MEKFSLNNLKIWVPGSNGMVSSAIIKKLKTENCKMSPKVFKSDLLYPLRGYLVQIICKSRAVSPVILLGACGGGSGQKKISIT